MIRLLVLIAALLSLPAALAAQPAAGAPLAMNLSRVNDWSAQQPFIDVMKTARPWIGHEPGRWGGVEMEELAERGLLDEAGWPTSIPGDLSSIGTLILTDLPEGASAYAGRYVLRFEGQGIVEVSGAATNKRYGEGEVSFDFEPGGMVILKIQRSDPRGTGDYVRNITVVREDHAEAWARGEVFNPAWLAYLDGFEAIRFMNWMQTNDSTQESWAGRPKPGDFSYAWRGVPAEVMIALANRLGAAPWFNMPHLAGPDYSRAFALLTLEQLDPALRVYVEYSNEVWNWQFDQTEWAAEKARARWGQEHRGHQFYGMRAAEVAQAWAEVWAGERERLVNVIATQTGWLGLEEGILEAPLWVEEDPGANLPPHASFDAYAVTGYFGYELGTDERRETVRGWIRESEKLAEAEAAAQGLTGEARTAYLEAHQFDAATGWAAQELLDGGMTGEAKNSLTDLLARILPYHAEVAEAYGLDLVAYEGGTHVAGVGRQVDDDTLTAFFTHLNYTPEMAALYERLLAGWPELGGGLFAFYSDVLVPTKWGSWGHLRHLGDENPRWEVIERAKRRASQ
ncbi:MAG: hypothetical protein RIG84_19540 [Roseovarius sp.]